MDSRPEQHIQARCNWLSRLPVYWFLIFFYNYLGYWVKDTALNWLNQNKNLFLQSISAIYQNTVQCRVVYFLSNTSTWHPGCISNEAAVFMSWHNMKKTATTNLHHIRSPSQPFFSSSHNTPLHKQLLRKLSWHFFDATTGFPLKWETSAEIWHWRRVTTQMWEVCLIGCAAKEICFNQLEELNPGLGSVASSDEISVFKINSFLRHYFLGKTVLASWNGGCFLRLHKWLLRIKFLPQFSGADLGGGCRGCAPLPPSEMTCSFLIQLVFCKKKLNVVYWR